MTQSPLRSGTSESLELPTSYREVLQLSLLILVAIGAFVGTRAVAANNRLANFRDGAEWYRRAEQAMASGRVDEAVEDFRRATVRDRTDKSYALALARALVAKGETDLAQNALSALRQAAPEDPEVNLELARLAANRADLADATRFYHSALYAAWPVDQVERRRQVRIEFIRMLLAHGEVSSALSELLALSANLPDDVPHRLVVASLFAQAGDHGSALKEYEQAVRRDASSTDALAGAGLEAFRLGNYPLALDYLRQVPERQDVRDSRETAELVVADDPLAARVPSSERTRRLKDNWTYARQRFTACPAGAAVSAGPPVSDLDADMRAFEPQLRPSSLSPDTLEGGVELVGRLVRDAVGRCPPATLRDQALALIARSHGVGVP